jgi:hypothetical protein
MNFFKNKYYISKNKCIKETIDLEDTEGKTDRELLIKLADLVNKIIINDLVHLNRRIDGFRYKFK